MTAHLHGTYVEGCFRCELSADEVAPARVVHLHKRTTGNPDGLTCITACTEVVRGARWTMRVDRVTCKRCRATRLYSEAV